jgi:hypothetical protein
VQKLPSRAGCLRQSGAALVTPESCVNMRKQQVTIRNYTALIKHVWFQLGRQQRVEWVFRCISSDKKDPLEAQSSSLINVLFNAPPINTKQNAQPSDDNSLDVQVHLVKTKSDGLVCRAV